MRVPVQMIEPTRLAQQAKGKEPLAHMEVVGPPLPQPSRKPEQSTNYIQPSEKLGLPINSTLGASDMNAIGDAQFKRMEQSLVNAEHYTGQSHATQDNIPRPLPSQEVPMMTLAEYYMRTSRVQDPPMLGPTISEILAQWPPEKHPHLKPLQELLVVPDFTKSSGSTQLSPKGSLKRSLPAQDSLTLPLPPHKAPKWTPSLPPVMPSLGGTRLSTPESRALVKQFTKPIQVSPAGRSSSPRTSSSPQPSRLEESTSEPMGLP